MKSEKLFQLLVVGGSLLAAQPGTANELNLQEPAGAPVFCGGPETCEQVQFCSEEGEVITKLVVKEGLQCCWGTSCDSGSLEDSND